MVNFNTISDKEQFPKLSAKSPPMHVPPTIEKRQWFH